MEDKSIAITGLLAALAADSRVYVLERRRSRSATTWSIDVLVVDEDRAIQSIGADVATLVDLPWSPEHKSLEIRGSPRRVEAVIARVGDELFGPDENKLRLEWL